MLNETLLYETIYAWLQLNPRHQKAHALRRWALRRRRGLLRRGTIGAEYSIPVWALKVGLGVVWLEEPPPDTKLKEFVEAHPYGRYFIQTHGPDGDEHAVALVNGTVYTGLHRAGDAVVTYAKVEDLTFHCAE